MPGSCAWSTTLLAAAAARRADHQDCCADERSCWRRVPARICTGVGCAAGCLRLRRRRCGLRFIGRSAHSADLPAWRQVAHQAGNVLLGDCLGLFVLRLPVCRDAVHNCRSGRHLATAFRRRHFSAGVSAAGGSVTVCSCGYGHSLAALCLLSRLWQQRHPQPRQPEIARIASVRRCPRRPQPARP